MAKSTKAKKKPAKKKTAEPKKPGRPSKFSQDIVDTICQRLALGGQGGLAEICREEDMPGLTTVYDWEKAHPGVAEAFARAREEGIHAIAKRLRATARGKGEADGGDSSGDVQRDKLIVDTDLKLLAKWAPRLYGDKVQHADADGNKLEVPQWIVNPVAPKGAE